MIKKGVVVTIIFIISTFIQLISQIVVTRIFGAKLNLDIYLAAVVIPTIVVTVIYGTLNDAFLPLLGEQKSKNPKNSDTYFLSMLLILSIFSLFIAGIAGFFSKPISELLYKSRGLEFVQSVAFQMNYLFYSIPVSVIATLLGSYYYIHKNFNRFPIAQAVGSIVNLATIIILAPYFGTMSLVIAFIFNILIQIFFVIPSFKHFSFSNFSHFLNFKYIWPLVIAWIPLIIGNFALRSDAIIIRSFGSSLPAGYLVYLNLISKIFSLATGVMTIGIQILLLPHLIEYINKKEYKKTIQTVNKAKVIAIGVSVFVTICLIVFAPIAIYLLFVGGKFTKHDADTTISLLPYFIMPAIGWGIVNVFYQPLLAMKKQIHLGLLNIFAFAASWIIGSQLLKTYSPMIAISAGLIILLGTGIIGSEILWQYYKKKLI
ncbi:MAG: lipid II flippase MurJ [bacterium]|nr:lipid II flippase MurJ [bacterium]